MIFYTNERKHRTNSKEYCIQVFAVSTVLLLAYMTKYYIIIVIIIVVITTIIMQ